MCICFVSLAFLIESLEEECMHCTHNVTQKAVGLLNFQTKAGLESRAQMMVSLFIFE